MVWDDETIRLLRDLWTQGHSTAEIGRRLGVSKNAIVGKAHRLDLDARPSPIRRDVVKPATDRPASYPRMAGPTLPPLASANAPALLAASAPTNIQPLRPPVVLGPRPMAPTPPAAPHRLPRPVDASRAGADPPFRSVLLLADRRAGDQDVPVLR